jgi:hypothetical protein
MLRPLTNAELNQRKRAVNVTCRTPPGQWYQDGGVDDVRLY